MLIDPIIEELHATKEKLAREVNYDVHAFFERLREAERRHPERMADLRPEIPGNEAMGAGDRD